MSMKFNRKGLLIGMAAIFFALISAGTVSYVREIPISRRNACISHLRWIEGTKAAIALKKNLKDDDTISLKNLQEEPGSDWALKCPSSGTYTINPIGKDAVCSVPSHQLPDGKE